MFPAQTLRRFYLNNNVALYQRNNHRIDATRHKTPGWELTTDNTNRASLIQSSLNFHKPFPKIRTQADYIH